MERAGINPNTNRGGDRPLEIKFLGSTEKDQQPRVALYSLEKGAIRKIRSIEGNRIMLSELVRLVKEGAAGFGPDVDEKEVSKEMLSTFRPQKLTEWATTGLIDIGPKWRDWIFPFVCVHGDVHKCRPWRWWTETIVTTVATKAASASSPKTAGAVAAAVAAKAVESRALVPSRFSPASELAVVPHLPPLCAPICNAIVEVYQKTCCCTWPPIITDIDIVDWLREWIEKFPPIPPIDPWPPGPFPGPGPDPAPFFRETRNAKIARALDRPLPLGNVPERLVQDVHAMSLMTTPAERMAYLEPREYLCPIFCSCSTKKVTETAVSPDGEFSVCFRAPLTPFRCRVTYFYKVRQWQGNQWVYIYDGSTVNEYFSASDDAHLRTWKGIACSPDGGGIPNPGGEFVMLENIGVIPSWKLASPAQDSEYGVATPVASDGLVSHNYPGQPWGKTLSFRLKFTEGLKALGAKYYRMSVAKASAAGDAVGTPQQLTGTVAWSRWKWVGSQLQTEAVPLGPNVVGTNSDLYLIPYESDAPDGGWLWFQFHQSWNTAEHDNGKHVVIVEVFDAAGNRIKPAGAPGAGSPVGFTFRRWTDETNTAAVNFAALTHLFHVDNVACYGDIVALRKNNEPAAGACLFLQGCTDDNFAVRFYAFHVNNFMQSYSLWAVRGLNDATIPITDGTSNAPSPIPSVLDADSAAIATKTFAQMLGPHQKCAFAIELRVRPKHTNGFGVLDSLPPYGYAAAETAAVALEQVPCVEISRIPQIAEKVSSKLPE